MIKSIESDMLSQIHKGSKSVYAMISIGSVRKNLDIVAIP